MANDTDKSKIISADGEAKKYFDLQMSLKGSSRFANILLTFLTMGFVFVFAALFWILPDRDFSPEENRSLAKAPEMTVENLFSGNLTEEFSDYMADQFPARGFFVGVKAVGELAQGKQENNDVFVAKDNYLIARVDYPDEKNLQKNISAAGRFIAAAEDSGINCTAAFAGRKADVCYDKLPAVYNGKYYSDRIWGILDDMCKASGFDFVNLRDVLRTHEADGEEVYYRTDHHWNSYGAYIAYTAIGDSVGYKPLPLTDFEKEKVTDSFLGTTWSASGIKWQEGEEIDFYRWEGDGDFTMRILDPSGQLSDCEGQRTVEEDGDVYSVFDSYYIRDFLDKKDKYASFIGGNFGYTEIYKNTDGQRETLLILKDSFANSMVQFLARDYDLIMIDLRYYKANITRLCEEKDIKNVLLLYNMETLTESSDLVILNTGLRNK